MLINSTSPAATFWNVAFPKYWNAPVLYALFSSWNKVWIVPKDGRSVRRAPRGLMGVMILRYCPPLQPRPHSTPSQQRFPRRAMERDGYSACHNGHFTAERERFCQGTMGLFREVLLPPLRPALGLCSHRAFIRLLLSPIWWRCVCRRPRGRVREWPPFIP